MIPLAQSGDIRYGLLEHAEIDGMSELLATVFSHSEPMAVAAGLTLENVRALVNLYGRRAPGDGLTVIAREEASGKIVGAILNDDFGDPPPDSSTPLPQGFQPIVALLEELDGRYRMLHPGRAGKILHIFMMAVDPNFGGKGIARSLVELALANGKNRGYERAITEATGKVSQHIFRAHGFIDQVRIAYRDFSFGGTRPFGSIADHEAVILMERDLTT